MAANSIAPSVRALDLYLDGSDWKIALFTSDGATQVASTTIGDVTIGAAGVVDLTTGLDLRALGGTPANELRIFASASSSIKVVHASPASNAFPVAELAVANGEVIGQQIEKLVEIGANITRVSIAWGG